MDPRRAPGWILFRDACDGKVGIGIDLASAEFAGLTTKSPEDAKACTMPADDSLRLDDDQSVAPTGPKRGQRDPKETVPTREMWPRMSALECRDLLSQGEDLQAKIVARKEEGTKVSDEC